MSTDRAVTPCRDAVRAVVAAAYPNTAASPLEFRRCTDDPRGAPGNAP